MSSIQSICVYCGSSPGADPVFEAAARTLGKTIADHHIRLVYGGGTNGLMGAAAKSATEYGGKVTGIIPKFLMDYEASEGSLDFLDELVTVEDMHQRKHLMFDRSDAFVALPGGIGTLEELIEIMTWAQLGRHTKPIVLANVDHFWDPLIALLDHMTESGFLKSNHSGKPIVLADPAQIVPTILSIKPASGDEAIIRKL